MSAAQAIPFPVNAQGFRISGVILAVSTLRPITGALTGLAATISIDGAAFAATSSAPVEIGTTGFFTLDLTAAEMTGSTIIVNVVATNVGAVYDVRVINPLALSEPTGRYDAASVVRLEQLLTQVYQFMHNYQGFNAAGTSYNIYKADSATLALSATISETSTSANQTKFT